MDVDGGSGRWSWWCVGRLRASGIATRHGAGIDHARNNEIGTIQSIREISDITRRNGILLRTDAAQSVGKIPVDVQTLGVGLLTLAGHKFYATKGMGSLYVRRGTPTVNILFGAGQEHGLHPGTENVPAIAGLGAASRLARGRLPSVGARLRATRDALHEQLQAAIPGLVLNGHPTNRLPNTLHVSFPGVGAPALLQAVSEHVAPSVGSACHSAGMP